MFASVNQLTLTPVMALILGRLLARSEKQEVMDDAQLAAQVQTSQWHQL